VNSSFVEFFFHLHEYFKMFYPALFVALATFRVDANPQPQAPRPSNMPKLGQAPVAFGPKPAGCSNFEILVGKNSS
jgi:hypothetical protein